MKNPNVVDHDEWLRARLALLAEEKAFTRARDALSAQRRALPWERVGHDYVFTGEAGSATLTDLFDGRRQLIVQHFMFGPGWEAGCKSCSFWADQFNPAVAHLNARDVSFVAVSDAPYAELKPFQQRMGWTFRWVSAAGSGFSHDYLVHYTPAQIAAGDTFYNYRAGLSYGEHSPGVSVFALGDDGAVYHTYSCYARGLDMLNGAYHLLDLVPQGRNEEGLDASMAWLRLHDSYEA
jgi:predicted dithiol-disulfide oxidoreductase (DUF899 family)